jgi:hypothetical protein
MSVITFPDYRVASFLWHKANQATTFRSIWGNQSLDAASPLWEVAMTGVAESRDTARQIETFIESLNGYTNQLALWDVEHPVPSGTMRGTMTFNASAAQGATGISVTAGSGQAGKTLLVGDLIGFGTGLTQQVVRITANATADVSGTIALTIGTPLRNAFASGAAVTWNKPAALFRLKSLDAGLTYKPDGADAWTLDLLESPLP